MLSAIVQNFSSKTHDCKLDAKFPEMLCEVLFSMDIELKYKSQLQCIRSLVDLILLDDNSTKKLEFLLEGMKISELRISIIGMLAENEIEAKGSAYVDYVYLSRIESELRTSSIMDAHMYTVAHIAILNAYSKIEKVSAICRVLDMMIVSCASAVVPIEGVQLVNDIWELLLPMALCMNQTGYHASIWDMIDGNSRHEALRAEGVKILEGYITKNTGLLSGKLISLQDVLRSRISSPVEREACVPLTDIEYICRKCHA